MCGRLVNLDTVARVLAEYYHLKTDTQLAALDEALSKVPAVSVGGGHGKDHIADPGKMVGDLISRQWLMECVNEGWIKFDTEKDENRFVHLVRDIAPSAQLAQDLPNGCTDTISRQAAIDAVRKAKDKSEAHRMLTQLPSAQSELVRKIYAIGYTGKEGRIYIGGRLFAVRELAQ